MTTPMPTSKVAFPVSRAYELSDCPEERRWLIEGLWSEEAVGIVGGEPKCGKSFLALDMAVAVASGTPCLRRFAVARGGRVLLFAAEDGLSLVRRRLDGVCRAAGVDLAALDIQVITAPTVRLDLRDDRQRLAETVAILSPRVLILDPFVRLHRIDENVSAEVAPLLAFLRDLQREHRMAVVVVHHAKKGAAKARDGQALRGSSEFHAWGDSNLYVRRHGERLLLAIEHRAAPSTTGIPLRLRKDGEALALEVFDARTSPSPPSEESPLARVERILADSPVPLGHDEIRRVCRIRASTLTQTLVQLVRDGRIAKSSAGYALAST